MFLVQSDETEFIEFITNKFPNNSFYFNDEIRHMKQNKNGNVDKIAGNGGDWNSDVGKSNYEHAFKFMAILIIMSKCKHLVLNMFTYTECTLNLIKVLGKTIHNTTHTQNTKIHAMK